MTIAEELASLSEAASFTISDMALWCGFDRSAMRQWITGSHTPHPVRQKQLRIRMALIRSTMLRPDAGGLPIPADVKSYDRPQYVKQVLGHALANKFPKANSSRAGRKNMDQHSE